MLLVGHTEATVHGLSSNRNTTDSQDDEDSTTGSNDYDEFKILCDLYGQERTDEPRWVALEVWWWSDIIRTAIWTAFEVYRSQSAHRPTKVFHLPWEYLDSSIGFRLQQSVPKGTQGATVNTLRVPEIHATKGMVDEQLIFRPGRGLLP